MECYRLGMQASGCEMIARAYQVDLARAWRLSEASVHVTHVQCVHILMHLVSILYRSDPLWALGRCVCPSDLHVSVTRILRILTAIMSESKDSSLHSIASDSGEDRAVQLDEELKNPTMRQRLSTKT